VRTTGADGVTEFEAADAALVPAALVAVTLNVYAVPFVKPVSVVDVAGAAIVTGPVGGFEVTV